MRSNGSPALTGQYLVDMLPQPGILSMQENFVASGRQVLPLTGVADLELGDLVGVAHAPLCASRYMPCYTPPTPQNPTLAKLQTTRSQLSQVRLPQVKQPRPWRRPQRRYWND